MDPPPSNFFSAQDLHQAQPLHPNQMLNTPYEDFKEDSEDSDMKRRRRRANIDQTSSLDEAFSINPNPDGNMRRILGEQLGMTPRSVQIWFQNRRARIRLASRNGAEINPNDIAALTVINAISKRGRKQGTYYQRKPKDEDSIKIERRKPPRKQPQDSFIPHRQAYTDSYAFIPSYQQQQAGIKSIPIDTLLWGTWRRTLTPQTTPLDLQMHMDTIHRCIYITIESGGQGAFRIEVMFDAVASIIVEDRHYAQEEEEAKNSDIIVTAVTFELHPFYEPPRFYMLLNGNGSNEWVQCSDFTENGQGTSVPSFTVLAGGGVDNSVQEAVNASDTMKNALAMVVTNDVHLALCVVSPEAEGAVQEGEVSNYQGDNNNPVYEYTSEQDKNGFELSF